MGKASGPIGSNSPNRVAALAVLDQAPSGKYARDLAAVLDMTPGRVSKMLQNLRCAGVIGSLHEGGGEGSARRVRYFALQHEAAAKAAHEASKGVTWGCGRKQSKPAKQQPRLVGEPGHLPEPIVRPSTTDHRFTVHQPEPFFSKPGYSPSFIGHDTWAAKAYA